MTDLIHTRHTETGRIQAVTPDQFEVFSDVLEEITPEEAEQARLDAILFPTMLEPVEEPAPKAVEEPAPKADDTPTPKAKPRAAKVTKKDA